MRMIVADWQKCSAQSQLENSRPVEKTQFLRNGRLFANCYLASENWSPWAIVRRCLRDPAYSNFDKIPACVGRMDGRTGRRIQSHSIYHVIASRGEGNLLQPHLLETSYDVIINDPATLPPEVFETLATQSPMARFLRCHPVHVFFVPFNTANFYSEVNKDSNLKAKARTKDQTFKAMRTEPKTNLLHTNLANSHQCWNIPK